MAVHLNLERTESKRTRANGYVSIRLKMLNVSFDIQRDLLMDARFAWLKGLSLNNCKLILRCNPDTSLREIDEALVDFLRRNIDYLRAHAPSGTAGTKYRMTIQSIAELEYDPRFQIDPQLPLSSSSTQPKGAPNQIIEVMMPKDTAHYTFEVVDDGTKKTAVIRCWR